MQTQDQQHVTISDVAAKLLIGVSIGLQPPQSTKLNIIAFIQQPISDYSFTIIPSRKGTQETSWPEHVTVGYITMIFPHMRCSIVHVSPSVFEIRVKIRSNNFRTFNQFMLKKKRLLCSIKKFLRASIAILSVHPLSSCMVSRQHFHCEIKHLYIGYMQFVQPNTHLSSHNSAPVTQMAHYIGKNRAYV